MLDVGCADWGQFSRDAYKRDYHGLSNPVRAYRRDVRDLSFLRAISIDQESEATWRICINLNWPAEITETEFFQRIKAMPRAKTDIVPTFGP